MPLYSYRAKNLKGEEQTGTLEAADKHQLALLLRQQGYFLLSESSDDENPRTEKKKSLLPAVNFFSRLLPVPLTEKLFFTRNLGVMIKTGVSLVKAFEILASQTKNKKFKKVLLTIASQTTKGESLSNSLAGFPEVFPPLFQETVKVGEETGRLEDSLKILSVQMEREHSLKSKVKSAMIYPVMVLSMAFIIGIFMMIFAIPNLKASFKELNMELPLTTRTILGVSDFLVERWPLAILVVVVLIVALIFGMRSGKGGKLKSMLTLKIPIISKITRQTNSSLTLRTLSSLLEAGVPIVRSLEVASGALSNFYFKESLRRAAVIVEKGEKLSQALNPYRDVYSPMVLQMVEVGEETGETSKILSQLADFFEEEVVAATQRLSSVIEPILILLIGAVVGFFAISMMQPMFKMMQGIG